MKLEFDDIVCCWTAICSTSSNENKADPTGPLLIYLFITKRASTIYLFIYEQNGISWVQKVAAVEIGFRGAPGCFPSIWIYIGGRSEGNMP